MSRLRMWWARRSVRCDAYELSWLQKRNRDGIGPFRPCGRDLRERSVK